MSRFDKELCACPAYLPGKEIVDCRELFVKLLDKALSHFIGVTTNLVSDVMEDLPSNLRPFPRSTFNKAADTNDGLAQARYRYLASEFLCCLEAYPRAEEAI